MGHAERSEASAVLLTAPSPGAKADPSPALRDQDDPIASDHVNFPALLKITAEFRSSEDCFPVVFCVSAVLRWILKKAPII
jgi:hypothetical protein